MVLVEPRVLRAMAAGDHSSRYRSRTGSRRRHKPAPLPAPVCRTVAEFASEFRKQHGLQDRSAADRVVRLLRASITPRRPKGRPATPQVRRAAEMRQQGAEWKTIYAAVIPDFTGMDKYKRAYWTPRLRGNVKAYMKRRGWRCGKHRVK